MGEEGGGRSRGPDLEAGRSLLSLQALALRVLHSTEFVASGAVELAQRTDWDGPKHGSGVHSGG